MRVETAFWADKVTNRPDGRLDVEGFGPFVLGTSHLPMQFPSYSLPVILRFSPQDKGRSCPLRYTIFTPGNKPLRSDQVIVRSPYPQTHDIVAVKLEDFELATEGIYRVAFEAGAVRYDVFFDVLLRPELESLREAEGERNP